MLEKTDISDRVFLTPAAVQAWSELAKKAIQLVPTHLLQDIGEEVITLNPDGKTLTVSCTIGKGEVTMLIPEGQWSYVGYAQ